MKQVIVKMCGSGSENDLYRIDLPSYQIIDINYETTPYTATILVPNDEVDDINGVITLSLEKIRYKYRGQKWDNPNVCKNCCI